MYGWVSPVRGALAVAEGARHCGLTRLMLPSDVEVPEAVATP